MLFLDSYLHAFNNGPLFLRTGMLRTLEGHQRQLQVMRNLLQ